MFLETSSFRGIIFSTQNVMNGNLFVRSFQTNSKDKDIHEKTQMVFWDAQKTTMRCQFSQVSHGHENEAIPNGEGLCFFREGDGLDKIVRLLATILVHKYDAASYIYIYMQLHVFCSWIFDALDSPNMGISTSSSHFNCGEPPSQRSFFLAHLWRFLTVRPQDSQGGMPPKWG